MEDAGPAVAAAAPGHAPKRSGLVALVALTFIGAQGAPASQLRPAAPQALAAHASSPPDDVVSLLSLVLKQRSKEDVNGSPQAKVKPLVVKLRRHGSTRDDASEEGGAKVGKWHDASYVGSLYVGGPRPQHLEVSFDTASGQIVLPSSRCQSPACREHRRFAVRASATATDINGNGADVQMIPGATTIKRDAITIGVSSMHHGTGKAVGDLVRDKVCLGRAVDEERCMEVGFVAVTNMTDKPFRAMAHDGIVGLGMKALTTSPIFHLLSRIEELTALPRSFGLFLDERGGELALGGFNPSRLRDGSASLQWAPVLRPEEGYWQLSIRSLQVGNSTLACHHSSKLLPSGCRGIIDSSASGIGMPDSLAALLALPEGVQAGLPCAGPNVTLEVEDVAGKPLLLTLSSKDYHSEACESMVMPTQLAEEWGNVFLLGQPFLKKFYTVFDWDSRKIGFGPAAFFAEEVSSEPAQVAENESQAEPVAVLTTLEAEEIEQALILNDIKAERAHQNGRAMFEARTLALFLLQGLIMQALVVLLLILAGARNGQEPLHSRVVLARLSHAALSRLGIVLPGNNVVASALLAMAPLKEQDTPDASECVVCLGSREEECCGGPRPRWCQLRCGHCFHQDCIFEWLQKAQRCPICRSHILEGEEKRKRVDEIPSTAEAHEES